MLVDGAARSDSFDPDGSVFQINPVNDPKVADPVSPRAFKGSMQAFDLRAYKWLTAEVFKGTVELPQPFLRKFAIELEGFVGEPKFKHGV